jgi:four helix bundle protein
MDENFESPSAPDCMTPRSVEDLDVWRDAISLVKSVYAVTRAWPRDELYGLVSQARRSAVSIPSNLAEGRGRESAPEMRRFSQIALGSAYELDTLLVIAKQLGFPEPEPTTAIRNQLDALIRRIQNFIRYQESKCR